MILEETYTLSNSVKIPKLGLGTWLIPNDETAKAVEAALKMGYRHIDTAQAYQNERGAGSGLKASGIARDEVFVTTKLAAELKSYDGAAASIDESRDRLGLDVIDMMLIHSPQPWNDFGGADRYYEGNREAWRALEDAYQAGKLRAIGVSNFDERDLDNILASCTVKPMVNQVLAHISNMPTDLIRYSQGKGLMVEAYSPIAHGELMKNRVVAEVAERYGVSVPQLAIRFTLQLGLLPLPKTANPAHLRDNAGVDFVISDEDMDRLENVEPIGDYGESSMFPVYAVDRT